MPNLMQSLQGHDLGHLRIVAELWGIPFNAPDARSGVHQLAARMLEADLAAEVIEVLPEEARRALDDLLKREGRIAWPLFTRRYGSVRAMGPVRRDRERPYLDARSAAEVLWYRGFFGRAFFDTETGPQEFAYIPDDLLRLLPDPNQDAERPLGRPASHAERTRLLPAGDRILDEACSLLAALRMGEPGYFAISDAARSAWPVPPQPAALQALLAAAGLLQADGALDPEPVRTFLEAPRGEALALLAQAWRGSSSFDELRLTPGLKAEGEWQNDPLRTRQILLSFLKALPGGVWWCLPAWVASIRETHPDFQRPAGDYDSWFLRHESSGEFLRGFAHWDDVDGALIRFMICGPMFWLGLVDLAQPANGQAVSAFRLSAWAENLFEGRPAEGLDAEEGKLIVRSDGRLRVPRLAPRAVRYQIARFCEWEAETEQGYSYRITPPALARARQQGLRIEHLIGLLRRQTRTVPPSLVKALDRWQAHGSQARMERVMVLRLSSPELLQALRASRAARFLGDPLGPTAVIVQPGAWQKVAAFLAEIGYLTEVEDEE